MTICIKCKNEVGCGCQLTHGLCSKCLGENINSKSTHDSLSTSEFPGSQRSSDATYLPNQQIDIRSGNSAKQ